MNMKCTLMALLVCVFTTLPLSAGAASCSAAVAAQAGSEAGYNRAKAAAEAWHERESNASSKLQDCLDQLKSISLTLPTFTSLSDILDKYADKLCKSVTSEINEYIPSTLDPWGDLTN